MAIINVILINFDMLDFSSIPLVVGGLVGGLVGGWAGGRKTENRCLKTCCGKND